MATVVGGANFGLALSPSELQAAQDALSAIGSGYTDAELHNSLQDPTNHPDFLQVYDLPGGGDYVLDSSEQVVILSGDTNPFANTTITGNGFNGLVIGNQGNDTVNFNSGNGTFIGGDGNNIVNIGGTDPLLQFGTGIDTVNMSGGAATINQLAGGNTAVFVTMGTNTIDGETPLFTVIQGGTNDVTMNGGLTKILGGSNTVTIASGNDTVASYGGSTSVDITGTGGTDYIYSHNDTVSLGSGDDTVIVSGNATVFAGSGNQQITAINGNDSLVAGSGSATIAGVSGNDTFVGAAGHDTFVASSGQNLFSFSSDSAAGGTHVIQGFTDGRDQLQLVGYDTSAALNNAQIVGGSTLISLDSGHTTITLTNFTNLNSTDVKH